MRQAAALARGLADREPTAGLGAPSEQLHRRRIAPLVLGPADRRLVIVADGVLGALPAALIDPATGGIRPAEAGDHGGRSTTS